MALAMVEALLGAVEEVVEASRPGLRVVWHRRGAVYVRRAFDEGTCRVIRGFPGALVEKSDVVPELALFAEFVPWLALAL